MTFCNPMIPDTNQSQRKFYNLLFSVLLETKIMDKWNENILTCFHVCPLTVYINYIISKIPMSLCKATIK